MSKIIIDTISNLVDEGYIVLKNDIYLDLSSVDTLQLPSGTEDQKPIFPSDGFIWWNQTRNSVEWYSSNSWFQLSLEEDYDKIEKVGSTLYLDTYDNDSYSNTGNNWISLSKYYTNNPTNVNGVFFDSNENSFYFDSTDKIFSVPEEFATDSMRTGTGSTYSFWFKSISTLNYSNISGGKILFSVVQNDGTSILKIGVNPSGNGIYYYDNNIGVDNTVGTSNYNNDIWHNLTITRPFGDSGQNSTFYVNGVQIGTLANTNPDYNSGNIISIGGDSDGTNIINTFGGYVSIVLVYERLLNSNEILDNFNYTKYRYGL